MGQVHVLTGISRRRWWSEEEKRALVAEAFCPGVVVADVARRADINSGQLYRWRKELKTAAAGFAQVFVSSGLPSVTAAPEPTIEVMVGSVGQVRMPISVSPGLADAPRNFRPCFQDCSLVECCVVWLFPAIQMVRR